MNWKTIWRVPAVTLIGGYIGFFVLVRLLTFAIVTMPDGTVTSDPIRQLLIYGVFLAVFVGLFGVLFMRKMSRKEVFQSATVTVVLCLAYTLVSYIIGPVSGTVGVVFMNLSMPLSWMEFPRSLLHLITGEYNVLGAVLTDFVPYLFILFGKKD